jgi:glyoxylase-like metal-dependent hydrolase (beta-lactamase superfamily II)
MTSAALPHHVIFAIRYATRPAMRHDHFIGGDPHDAPMPMDYFTWAIVDLTGRVLLVDTGFTAKTAAARERTFLRCPTDGLRLLGIAPESIKDVVLTHLHYDHVGNFHKFPAARFHLQEREMAFATGRYMRYPLFGHAFEVEDIVGMVRLNFEGRVEYYGGDAELVPGVTLHLLGGHTGGLQIVRVHTARGWVVLASDATHFYENMQTHRPFTTSFHLGDVVDGFRTVERLAASPRHIVPGHDPLVMKQYPAPAPELEGVIVRLDVEPMPAETPNRT